MVGLNQDLSGISKFSIWELANCCCFLLFQKISAKNSTAQMGMSSSNQKYFCSSKMYIFYYIKLRNTVYRNNSSNSNSKPAASNNGR